MYLDCFLAHMTVFGCILVGETWPRLEISSFDGLLLGVSYWETSCSMELPYQALYTWYVVGTERLKG